MSRPLDPAVRDLLAMVHAALSPPWHADPDLPQRIADVQVAVDGVVRFGSDAASVALLTRAADAADAARVRDADLTAPGGTAP